MDQESTRRFVQVMRGHLRAWDPVGEFSDADDEHAPPEDVYDAAVPVLKNLILRSYSVTDAVDHFCYWAHRYFGLRPNVIEIRRLVRATADAWREATAP